MINNPNAIAIGQKEMVSRKILLTNTHKQSMNNNINSTSLLVCYNSARDHCQERMYTNAWLGKIKTPMYSIIAKKQNDQGLSVNSIGQLDNTDF